jgi:hypothetical protein
MMEVVPVPDDEQRSGPPPAVRPPVEPEPAPARPEPAPPPAIDPEQVRQFQQFQQFQELMRQQGGQNLLPGPRRPLWQRILLGRLVRKLALLALVLLGLYFAYDYYFGDDNENLSAEFTGGQQMEGAELLAPTPQEAVRKVYHQIAQNEPRFACGMFDETTGAAQQFASNLGFSNCIEAVSALHQRLDKPPGYKDAYAEPFRGAQSQARQALPNGDFVYSSCKLNVATQIGPRLGAFTVHRLPPERAKGEQWIIIAHQKESC